MDNRLTRQSIDAVSGEVPEEPVVSKKTGASQAIASTVITAHLQLLTIC
jgi:hypothetical protein